MGHTSSTEKMQSLLCQYAPEDPTRRVLEVGSLVIQDGHPIKDRYPDDAMIGGYRVDIEGDPLLGTAIRGKYTGLDIKAGTNVDIVADDPYHWPLEDMSFELILSVQCLEHVPNLIAFMKECYRCLVPGGLTIHIAPSTGIYHAFPVHCWMIMKDGMKWILEESGFTVLEADHWDKHPWNDCWGVGRKPQ